MSTSQMLLVLAGVIVFSMVGSLAAFYIALELLPEESIIAEEEPGPAFDLVGFEGGFVRLSKESGDLLIVNEKGISRFDQATSTHTKLVDFTYTGKDYPLGTADAAFPLSKGVLWLRIEYKLIGDQLKYKLEIGPYVEEFHKALQETTSSIKLCFNDSDNFEVFNAQVPLKAPTRVYNDDGTVSHLLYDGSEDCSREIYEMVTSVVAGWRYEDAFRTALEKSIEAALAIQDKQRKELQELLDDGVYSGVILGNTAQLTDESRKSTSVSIRNWPELIRSGNLKRALREAETEESDSPTDNDQGNAESHQGAQTSLPSQQEMTEGSEPESASPP